MKNGPLLLAFLVAAVAAFVFLPRVVTPGCRDTVVSAVPSPSGKLTAIHFTREYPSVPVTHHVVIQPSSRAFAIRRHETALLAEKIASLRLSWEREDTLLIAVEGGTVFEKRDGIHGVQVVLEGTAVTPEQLP